MELPAGVLGKAIKTARLEKHISQEALSEIVGITPTHLKHIESGHRKPSIDLLYRLVQELNISLDDVFFPKCSDGQEMRRKAERLLGKCNEKQLKIILATLEAMLSSN